MKEYGATRKPGFQFCFTVDSVGEFSVARSFGKWVVGLPQNGRPEPVCTCGGKSCSTFERGVVKLPTDIADEQKACEKFPGGYTRVLAFIAKIDAIIDDA